MQGACDSVPASIPTLDVASQPFTNVAYLYTLDNVTISGGPATFGTANLTMTITDASNNSMELFYWPTSYSSENATFDGTAIPTTPVNITGFVDVFGTAASPPRLFSEFSPIGAIGGVPEPGEFSRPTGARDYSV